MTKKRFIPKNSREACWMKCGHFKKVDMSDIYGEVNKITRKMASMAVVVGLSLGVLGPLLLTKAHLIWATLVGCFIGYMLVKGDQLRRKRNILLETAYLRLDAAAKDLL